MEVLIFFVLLLFGAFILEIYMLHKYNQSYQFWTDTFETQLESFDEVRKVLNGNAVLLRQVVNVTNEHDRILKAVVMVVDIHSEHLKIARGFREDLMTPALDGEPMDLQDDE